MFESTGSSCTDGELQLSGSELTSGGRLEMCFQGIWGTICDHNWIISNAIVACRQLGFKTEGKYFWPITNYVISLAIIVDMKHPGFFRTDGFW